MNKLMKRLLVLTIFVICILALTVLGASAASTDGYTDDAAAIADGKVARIGGTVDSNDGATYYTTLYDAVNAAPNNGTVYVLRDYTITKKFNMTKAVTIRSASDDEAQRVTLTLNINHLIDTDGNSASSVFTFDYININAGAHNISYLNRETLVIGANAYLYGSGSSSYGLIYADNNNAKVIVNGKVEITSGGNIAIKLKNSSAEINGTITRAANGNLFHLSGTSSLSITDGDYKSTGGNMFYLGGASATVSISGGSFAYTAATSSEFLRIEQIKSLTLAGGTFTRAGGTGDAGSFFYYVDANDNGTLKVENTFALPSCPVVFHNAVTFADDATAVNLGYVARVGETLSSSNYYKILTAAITAATDNTETTIYLLTDVESAAKFDIPAAKNVIIQGVKVGDATAWPILKKTSAASTRIYDLGMGTRLTVKDVTIQTNGAVFYGDAGDIATYLTLDGETRIEAYTTITGKIISFWGKMNLTINKDVVITTEGVSAGGQVSFIVAENSGAAGCTVNISGKLYLKNGGAYEHRMIWTEHKNASTFNILDGAELIYAPTECYNDYESAVIYSYASTGSPSTFNIYNARLENSAPYGSIACLYTGATFIVQASSDPERSPEFVRSNSTNNGFGIWANGATVTLNGGTYTLGSNAHGVYATGSAAVTVNGGSFTHSGSGSILYIVASNTINVTSDSGSAFFKHSGTGVIFDNRGTIVVNGEDVQILATGTSAAFYEGYKATVYDAYLYADESALYATAAGNDYDHIYYRNVRFDSDEMALKFYAATRVDTSTVDITVESATKTVYTGYYSRYEFVTSLGAGNSTTVYLLRDLTPDKRGNTLADNTTVTLDGQGHSVYINGSNGTTFLSINAGSSLSLQNITFNGCPTKFVSLGGDLTLKSGTTMIAIANTSTSETNPFFYITGAANLTIEEGASVKCGYTDDTPIDGEPGYDNGPTSYYIIQSGDNWTGTVSIGGSITQDWNVAGWSCIFRANGTGTLELLSTAVLTMNTAEGATAGNGMFVADDADSIIVSVPAVGVTLTSPNYPIFIGGFRFDTDASAINMGNVARLADSATVEAPYLVDSYYTTVHAAIADATNESNFITIIVSNIDITSNFGGIKKPTTFRGATGTEKLTIKASHVIDPGSVTTVTIENLVIDSGAYCLTWLNGDTLNIGNGAVITGSGNSTYGLIYAKGTSKLNILPGASITATGAYPAILMNEGSVITTISGGTVAQTGTGRVISLDAGQVNVTGGTVKTDNTSNNNYLINVASGATFTTSNSPTLSYNGTSYMFHSNGTVTLGGGEFTNSGTNRMFQASAGASYTVNSGTFTHSGDYMFCVNGANASATINGGTFNHNGSAPGLFTNSQATATITVTGGTFIGTDETGGNLVQASNGTINISGGEFNYDGTGYLIKCVTGATMNISGGEFKATAGKGLMESNGTFNVTANEKGKDYDPSFLQEASGYVFNFYGGTGNISAGSFEKTVDGNMMAASSPLTISGGTFIKSGTGSILFASSTLTITGGNFTHSGSGELLYSTDTANISGGTMTHSGTSTTIIFTGTLNITGTAVLKNTGSASKYVIQRDDGTYTVNGEGVQLIATGSNYIFEQGYSNDGTVITGAYLSAANNNICYYEVQHMTLVNVKLDNDTVATSIIGFRDAGSNSTHVFEARIGTKTTITVDGESKEVYSGYYSDYATAYAALTDGGTLYMVQDFTGFARGWTVDGKSITINGNGHTVAVTDATTYLYTVNAGATLTVVNTSYTLNNRFASVLGTLYVGSDDAQTALAITDNGAIVERFFDVDAAGVLTLNKNTAFTTNSATTASNNYNMINLPVTFTGTVNIYGKIEIKHSFTGNTKVLRANYSASANAAGAVNVYEGAEITFSPSAQGASKEVAIFYGYGTGVTTNFNIYGGTIKHTGTTGSIFLLHGTSNLNITGGTFERSNGNSTSDAYGILAYANTAKGALSISNATFEFSDTCVGVFWQGTGTSTISGDFAHEGTGSCIYIASTGAINFTGGSYVHSGTGETIRVSSATNAYITGDGILIAHDGAANGETNVALYRNSGMIYVNGNGGNITLRANNGAYLMRTAYWTPVADATLETTATTLGAKGGEDSNADLYRVVIATEEKAIAWYAKAVLVNDAKGTRYYTSVEAMLRGDIATGADAVQNVKILRNCSLSRSYNSVYSYTIPAGKTVNFDGNGKIIGINGSNGTRMFLIQAGATMAFSNVSFNLCPTKFALVRGTLLLNSGTSIIVTSTSSYHESSPIIALDGAGDVTLAQGASITVNSDGSEATVSYAKNLFVFATKEVDSSTDATHAESFPGNNDFAWDGTLTIAGSISYTANTYARSAFVYANNKSTGLIDVKSTATLHYDADAINSEGDSVADNGYFIVNPGITLTIPSSVIAATPVYEAGTDDETCTYILVVGRHMYTSADTFADMTGGSVGTGKFRIETEYGFAIADTLEQAFIFIRPSGSVTLYLLDNYTATDNADTADLAGGYDLTITSTAGYVYTLTEKAGDFLLHISGGARVTLSNVNLVTNGDTFRIDTGGTRSYLTFAEGTTVSGTTDTVLTGPILDIWGTGDFTLAEGASITTASTTASKQIELIVAQGSYKGSSVIAGNITHATAGNYNHKIIRMNGPTGTFTIKPTATLTHNCANVSDEEAAILYNYPDSDYTDIYSPSPVYAIEGGTFTHTSPAGSILYGAGYVMSFNVSTATFNCSNGGYFAYMTENATLNLTGGTINVSGATAFGGDKSGTHVISGSPTVNLTNTAYLFGTGEVARIMGTEFIFTADETSRGMVEGGDTNYIYYHNASFESDDLAGKLLAAFRVGETYYSSLSESVALALANADSATIYFVGDELKMARVAGSINIGTGKSLTIDGVAGNTMIVNGANDIYLFTVALGGELILTNIDVTNCPTRFADVAGTLTLAEGTTINVYTKTDNEAPVAETSPLVYLRGTSTVTVENGAVIDFSYNDDSHDLVDHQANVYVFHTDSAWNGTLTIGGTVNQGWNVAGHSPIFYLESTAGSIQVLASAIITHTGDKAGSGNALLMAPVISTPTVENATSFTIHKDAVFTIGLSMQIRLGDVFATTANTQRVLGYEVTETISVIITWAAFSFTYTPGEWNTEALTYEEGTWAADENDGGQITLTNTGNVEVGAVFTYTATNGFDDLEGIFYQGDNTVTEIALPVSETEHIITFLPSGVLSDQVTESTKIGIITITITEGGN